VTDYALTLDMPSAKGSYCLEYDLTQSGSSFSSTGSAGLRFHVIVSEPVLNRMYIAYPQYSEGGYADRRTVFQGDSITFHVASELPGPVVANVARAVAADVFDTVLSVQLGFLNSPRYGCTYDGGCNWLPSLTLTVPLDWPSGWYQLQFPVKLSSEIRRVDFIVAERTPTADALFIFDTQTSLGYNVYAGGSFYGGFDDTGAWRGCHEFEKNLVSWNRPLVRSHTYTCTTNSIAAPEKRPHFEEPFRAWVDRRFKVAYLSNDALDDVSPAYLQAFKLMVIVDTQEYVSNSQLAAIENYIVNGGKAYISAGEFAYGVLREEDGHKMRFHRARPENDPMLAAQPQQVAPIRSSMRRLQDFFGLSISHGYAAGFQLTTPQPLRVDTAGDALFAGTGLQAGDPLMNVIGIVPGAWLANVNGRLCITNSVIPCERVDVLAHVAQPPWRINVQATNDLTVDGVIQNTPMDPLPEFTNIALVVVRQGSGALLAAPGAQFNSAFVTPSTSRIIENWFVAAGALPVDLPVYGVDWLIHDTPAVVAPFSSFRPRITMANTGVRTWDPSVHALTYRWRPAGCPSTIVQGGNWEFITREVRRSEVLRDASVTVYTPATPGTYCLEYDIAEIPVLWFSGQGAATLRVTVQVINPGRGNRRRIRRRPRSP
jgi:hypothetical protein